MHTPFWSLPALAGLIVSSVAFAQPRGYYTSPALTDDAVIFTAEGDLWRVSQAGGEAMRLTAHPGVETGAVVSADGKTVAFSASYEGPVEVYTMPVTGGRPDRRTFFGVGARPAAFDPDGDLICTTRLFSGGQLTQLVRIEADGAYALIPLAEAATASFGDDGTLFFTRPDFQGSHTRRYKGGTARKAWSFPLGRVGEPNVEARPLTGEYAGESFRPQFASGRVYFLSDRDNGVMNVWSMAPDGSGVRAHTKETEFEVRGASVRTVGGAVRVVYQLGADLWMLDPATDRARRVDITLVTDLDQTREKWIKKPWDFLTAAHLSADGQRVVLTARGQVFVAPRKFGRFVEATRAEGVRYRDGRFMPDGKSLVALSDQSGEVELWTLPADGTGDPKQLTSDATVLRWQAVPSPDGRRIAHHDKNQVLWVFDAEKNASTKIDENAWENFANLTWSPDSRYLAYVALADNLNPQVKLYSTVDGSVTALTTDRAASGAPAWGADGKFLYFLSERNLRSLVSSPWGLMGPEPFFDRKVKVYALGLKPALRSPFEEPDEVADAAKEEKKQEEPKPGEEKKPAEPEKKDGADAKAEEKKPDEKKPDEKKAPAPIEIDLNGIQARLYEVPVAPGNYDGLACNDKALFFTDSPAGPDAKASLKALAIDADALKKREFKVETLSEGVEGFELSGDGKSILVRTESAVLVADAGPAKIDADKSKVSLDGWTFNVDPREEWRQMYRESWRLLRDYFYDPKMHGVDWNAMREKYAPLVERVASREDLADVMQQMTAELSALHHFVQPGDTRTGPDSIGMASLGAHLRRDEAAGGYRIERILRSDPDRPDRRSPLARPDLGIADGDVIERVNGAPALSAPDISELLRNQAGRQVLLHVKRDGPDPRATRPVVVKPIAMSAERDLRYHEWQEDRRAMVERLGGGEIGYVYLAAMGSSDFADFARQYYPVFNRKGLIIDVRNNNGGNIDPWVLSRLMRKAWMYWSPRVGKPYWGMQYAFRGHQVMLCDEWTASDGEAVTEGFKRLGLGKVIGKRTWGGEIWLSSSNRLVDNGIATAGEYGVFGPAGDWMIEGHGVEPDIVVENPPHATFRGEDAQLKAAIEHLQKLIREQPVPDLVAPSKPVKSR